MVHFKAESYCQQLLSVVATQAVESWLTTNPFLQTKHDATPQDFWPQFLQFVIGQSFSVFWVQEVEDPTMALKFCPIYFSKQPRQYRMILIILVLKGFTSRQLRHIFRASHSYQYHHLQSCIDIFWWPLSRLHWSGSIVLPCTFCI